MTLPRPDLDKLLTDSQGKRRDGKPMIDQCTPSNLVDAATLVEVLRWRASQEPHRSAYVWLKDGRTVDRHMTYGELDGEARRLATVLRDRIEPGRRALLLYGAGLDVAVAFWACLYAGVVAVPAPASEVMRAKRSVPRLKAILQDAAIDWVLSSSEDIARLSALFDESSLRCLDTTAVEGATDDVSPGPYPASDDIAYLQYTSGSTSVPRGVIIPHSALLTQCRSLSASIGWDHSSRSLCWLPYFHDYGLIHGIIAPAYAGIPAYLMSPTAFLRHPLRWIEAISRYRITHSGAPGFAYELCTRCAAEQGLPALDLSCWTVASCGAEPIRVDTVRTFIRTFAPVGFAPEAFTPAYGLAEHVLLVSAAKGLAVHEVDAEQLETGWIASAQEGRRRRALVSCGTPIAGTRVVIADPATGLRCAPNQVGEIWVSGPSIARGYWNKPADTQETFHGRVPGETDPYLRTGDLGCIQDGQLVVTGRLKDLIIIAGRNYAPQDIEETVAACHPTLRAGAAAAFSTVGDGGERVVVVQEIQRSAEVVDAEAVAAAIRRAIWDEHQLPVHAVVLIKAGGLCRTSSGKIQRHATRQAWMEGALPIVAESVQENLLGQHEGASNEPPTELEETLMQIWKQVLSLSAVGRWDNLFDCGAHSLHVTQIASRIEAQCGLHVPLRLLFEEPTVAGLANAIDSMRHSATHRTDQAIVSVRRNEGMPLSFSQQRMWFLYQLVPDGTAYNMPVALRLVGSLNRDGIRWAFQELVRRHESLRTTFTTTDQGPVQIIHPQSVPLWTDIDLRSLPEHERERKAVRLVEEDARRPFDLSKGPLLRVLLIQLADNAHIAYVNMHHIIGDQWSYGVIGRELATLYNQYLRGATPSGVPGTIQYADFAAWQREHLTDAALEKGLNYWRRTLAGLVTLSLPTDYVRPQVQRYIGSYRAVRLPEPLLADFTRVCADERATLFMGLLAAFTILLSRYSGQHDIAVGVPIANRTRVATETIVGTFVNTLVMRTDLSGAPSFVELLTRVRNTAIEAYEHQDVPFERLVGELAPPRDLSHSPLIQVLFNVVNAPLHDIHFDGLAWTPVEFDGGTSQFDLTLTVDPVVSKTASLAFRTDLFSAATSERLLNGYRTLLENIAAQPHKRISEYQILSADEQHRMLVEWNRTEAVYPNDRSLPALIAEQAERTPDAIAVSAGSNHLRYGELNRRATQLARYLSAHGVGRGDIVGISMERTPLEVVGLLAIMKTGAAYLPLDPAYPPERLQYMVHETRCRTIVTASQLAEKWRAGDTQLIRVDQIWKQILNESSAPIPGPAPLDLAYIIYTSGSTGKPKGVAIRHRSLVNFLWSMRSTPGCTSRDRWLAITTLAFDIAGLERYLPLVVGGRVELVDHTVAADGRLLRRRIQEFRPTMLQATPATWRMLLEAGWEGSQDLVALCGGEALSTELADRLLPRVRTLWNLYGPTETTIWSTLSQVTPEQSEITIGRPIANTRVYVLDAAGLPVPIGVPGELHIGGDGVAAGYHNRPDLTAERFIPDPFDAAHAERLYKTGDLVRYRPDGELVHLGRLDHQVKIRGFRIELGEIEAVLAEQAGVRQAVVVPKSKASGDKHLVAYVRPLEGSRPDAETLKAGLRRKLPDYMVPPSVVFVREFPLTPNGKVDVKALPAPLEEVPTGRGSVAQPRSIIEIQLAACWQQVLGLSDVDVHQSFFDLGGDSLKAVHLFALVEQTFNKPLPLTTIFQAPTIAQLAEIIAAKDWAPAWRSLVAIQPGGGSPPCFAVPGVGGSVLGFATLARRLGPDRPFYGLQPVGFEGHEPPLRSVKAMAAHYIEEIVRMRPRGPYVLIGICTGGVVAYEMAQQLSARQERVILIILESWHPLSYSGHLLRLKRLARPVLYVWDRLTQFVERSRHLTLTARLQLAIRKIRERIERLGGDTDGLMGGGPFINRRLVEATLEAIAFYKPEEYRGRLLNVTASKRPIAEPALDTRRLWEFLARGGATPAAVLAHNSGQLLVSPHVETLADLIRGYIEREYAMDDAAASADTAAAWRSIRT